MSFNFKKELENLDFKTPEGIAQIFLESIIEQFKKNHESFKDLHSLMFSLEKSSMYDPLTFRYWVLRAFYMLKYDDGSSYSEWRFLHKIEYDEKKAISIVEAIKEELKREGLNCKDITYNYINGPVKTFEVIF